MIIEHNRDFKQGNSEVNLLGATIMVTPPINEDYWTCRVPLSREQAIVSFPKFGTYGIGFQVEEDWNTNLPYTLPVDEIFNHIKHNKADDTIQDSDCKKAISLIRQHLCLMNGEEYPGDDQQVTRN